MRQVILAICLILVSCKARHPTALSEDDVHVEDDVRLEPLAPKNSASHIEITPEFFLFSMDPKYPLIRESLSTSHPHSSGNQLTMVSRNALEKRFINVRSEFDPRAQYLKIEISEMEMSGQELYTIEVLKTQISAREETENDYLFQIRTNVKSIEVFAELMANRISSQNSGESILAKQDILEMISLAGHNEEERRLKSDSTERLDHFNCLSRYQFTIIAQNQYPVLSEISKCNIPKKIPEFQVHSKL